MVGAGLVCGAGRGVGGRVRSGVGLGWWRLGCLLAVPGPGSECEATQISSTDENLVSQCGGLKWWTLELPLSVTGPRSSLHWANSLALVSRDSALRFSRTTSALAVEGIAEPLVRGQGLNRERPDFTLFRLGSWLNVGGAHAFSLALLGAEYNSSVVLQRACLVYGLHRCDIDGSNSCGSDGASDA